MTLRALELAAAGKGLVSPNPLVGCVIVSEDGRVVGEGTYIFEEIVHAEVVALREAGEHARNGTAYVSLEPHSHQGRTAPCTKVLISAGIKRVVAPIEDPNPLVAGRGFEELRASGIAVTTGILSDPARKLNEKFFVWHQKRRPFVHLKLAPSLDGRISLSSSVSTSISDRLAIERVHELRHENDAILIGGNTALVDDPKLTDRSGRPRRRPLLRIVMDNRLRLPLDSNLVTTAEEIPTMVVTGSKDQEKLRQLRSRGVEAIEMDARDLPALLDLLREREIQSVLVEGGTELAGAFLDAMLVDKLTFITAPLIIGGQRAPVSIGGKGAESIQEAARLKEISVERYGTDLEITGYPSFPEQ
jgi:diaminohydroxyphosphoribosylaminopyrimidine deaminase/5-amino-6-(5-phosphoribosylamino)uracil reductase